MKSTTHQIKSWWIPTLTGLFLIASALFFYLYPTTAFMGLSILFGWMIFTSGLMNIAFSIRSKRYFEGWIWSLLIGIFESIMGIALLFQPELSASTLILFAGFWLAFSAISKISFALYLKKSKLADWKFTLITGILMLIFSFFIIINPIFGMVSVVYLIAFPLLLIGIMAVYSGIQLKKMNVVKIDF